MAITHTSILAESFSPNTQPYTTTGTLTAVTGRLYVAGCSWSGTLRTFTSFVHNASSNPLTFTKRGDTTFSTIATPTGHVVSCTGLAAATSNAGTCTLTLSGNPSRANIFVSEFQGVDTSGTGILQGTLTNHVDSSASMNLVFSALGSSNNRMWVVAAVDKTTTFTADTNYVEIADSNPGEVCSQETQWDNGSGDLTCTITPAVSGAMGACGIEVVAGVTPITSSSAMTVVPTVTAAGTESLSGTVAATILAVVTASALVVNPVTGTAAITVAPTIIAAGAEALSGSATLTVVPSVTVAGSEKFTGAVAMTVAPTVVAAGAEAFSGSITLTITPTVVAAGAESLTGAVALTVVPAVTVAGAEAFSATVVVIVVPIEVASGTVSGGGPSPITGTSASTIIPSVASIGSEVIPELPPADAPRGVTLQHWEFGHHGPGRER
jgi:hypothetical protein